MKIRLVSQTYKHTHTHLGQTAPGTLQWCRCCRSRWIGRTQTPPPPLRSFLSAEPDADTTAVAPGTTHKHTHTHKHHYKWQNCASLQPFPLHSLEPCNDKDEMPSPLTTHTHTQTHVSEYTHRYTVTTALNAHANTPTHTHIHCRVSNCENTHSLRCTQ